MGLGAVASVGGEEGTFGETETRFGGDGEASEVGHPWQTLELDLGQASKGSRERVEERTEQVCAFLLEVGPKRLLLLAVLVRDAGCGEQKVLVE